MATSEGHATDFAPAAFHPPHVRGRWNAGRITAAFLTALTPPLAVALYQRPAAAASLLVLSAAIVLAWHALFAWWRGRAFTLDGLVTAAAFALMLPAGSAAWQVAIALSFGVVVGEQIFGGRGRNFLNSSVIALAFLIFSFPAAGYDRGGPELALASLPGAVLLIASGLISWRVVAAAAAGFVAAAFAFGLADPFAGLLAGSFAFAVVFLACDPVTAASTNPGRWLYGLIVGGLTALGRASDAGDGTVFAILIASMFAPLIDQAVIQINVVGRRRRYG